MPSRTSTLVVCTHGDRPRRRARTRVDARVLAHPASGVLIAAPRRDVVDIQHRLAALVRARPLRFVDASPTAEAMTDPSSSDGVIEDEYSLIETSLADPELLADPVRLRAVSKRYKDLTPLVECIARAPRSAGRRRRRTRVHERRVPATSASCGAPSWRRSRRSVAAARRRDPRCSWCRRTRTRARAVIMEIRGAEGGEEANLFARDLFEMYQAYAAPSGLEVRGAVQRPQRPRRRSTR